MNNRREGDFQSMSFGFLLVSMQSKKMSMHGVSGESERRRTIHCSVEKTDEHSSFRSFFSESRGPPWPLERRDAVGRREWFDQTEELAVFSVSWTNRSERLAWTADQRSTQSRQKKGDR